MRQTLLADAGYANGSNYAFLEERGITPWIPVFGQHKGQIEGFTYDVKTDTYTCSAGKALPFRKYDTSADGSRLKIYWAAYQKLSSLPRKSACVPTARRKQLTRTRMIQLTPGLGPPAKPSGPHDAPQTTKYRRAGIRYSDPPLQLAARRHPRQSGCPENDATWLPAR